MPQPPANAAAAERLIAVYQETQASLRARIEAVIADPTAAVARRRLQGLLDDVDSTIDRLEQAVHDWLEGELPPIWEAGGARFADEAGTSFTWTQHHLEAVQDLAERSWSDVLERTQFVRDETKATIRALARTAARRAVVEGETATRAGAVLAQQVTEATGLLSVQYADGSLVPVAVWGEMNARTTTALAYNRGTFTQAHDDGFDELEVFDGEGCGWTEHDDPDLADGSVRTLEDCEAYPISHPNCRRSFSPHVAAAGQ